MPTPIRLLIAAVVFGAGFISLPAAAQRPLIDEIVLPFDAEGRIDRIDRELLQQLRRDDPEIAALLGAESVEETFLDASLLHGPDSTYVLDTLVRQQAAPGDLVHHRRSMNSAEVGALRARVRAGLARIHPRGLTADHRTMLLVGSSLLGLAFYDWALPVSTDINGKEAVAAGMFAAAASFFGPYIATRSTRVSDGEANLALYGGTRGIAHGVLAYHAFRRHRNAGARVCISEIDCSSPGPDEGDTDEALAAALAGSVVEGIAGFAWARAANLSGSTAHAIGTGGDLGMLWGIGFTELLDGPDEFLDLQTKRSLDVGGLLGSALGIAAGRMMANRRSHTWGDIEVIRMSSFAGAATGLAIADLGSDDDIPRLGIALAGSAAGLALGDRWVRDLDLTAGQSILIDAGTLAGAALGLGIAYLATSEDGDDDSAPYTSAAALGALGGGAATFLAVRKSTVDMGSLQFDLSPFAAQLRWEF
jgi:hypothetical protein